LIFLQNRSSQALISKVVKATADAFGNQNGAYLGRMARHLLLLGNSLPLDSNSDVDHARFVVLPPHRLLEPLLFEQSRFDVSLFRCFCSLSFIKFHFNFTI
jgi:hypothetical protein